MISVLRFRLTPRIEELVVKRWRSVEEFERYVNDASNVKYMFEQRYVRRLAGADVEMPPSMVMVCGPVKLVIGDPYAWDSLSVPVIKAVVNVNKDDRNEAFGHTPIESEVQLLPVDRVGRAIPNPGDEPVSERRQAESPDEGSAAILPESQGAEFRRGGPRQNPKKPERPRRHPVDFYPLYKAKYPGDKVPVFCEREEEWRSVTPGAKYCPECGWHFPPLPTCPVCGADLVPGRGVYCSKCRAQLPANLAVPRQIAFSLKSKEFTAASKFNVELVEAIADRLRRGRDERRMILGPVLMVHLELRNERDASTLDDMNKSGETLERLGIGTIITDPYELKILRRQMELDAITSSDGGFSESVI